MNRIVPVLVAASLATSGAALAQNTNTLDSNGNATITNPGTAAPGTAAPGMGPTGAGTTMNRAPVVGGAAAGIAPMGTPPTVGGTSMGNGMAPGAAPPGAMPMVNGMNGNQRRTNGSAAADNPDRMNQAPAPGANSYTKGQARARIQQNGFTQVSGLHKDRQGVWRGKAMKDGQSTNVALDFQGRVVGQ